MKMKNNIIWLVILLIAVVAAIYYLEFSKPTVPQTTGSTQTGEGSGNAPELQGISGYINANDSLTIKSLRGKVVMVDFWTYSCINCIRTLPYLNAWNERYRDKGLVIIGVHTPEFSFEEKYDNVLAAVKMYNM